jgi:hypothetical protein
MAWGRTTRLIKLRWLVIIMLSVLLVGCSMEASTQVANGGGGSLSTAIGLTPADAAALSEFGGTSSEAFCQQVEARTKLPPGGTITQEKRDGTTWCVAKVPFKNLNELGDLYRQIGNIDVHQLQLTSGDFVYDMDIDLADLTAEGVDPAILDSIQISIVWKLTPPGKIGTNNADQVVDGTLIWTLQPGQMTHLHAESGLASPASEPAPSSSGIKVPNFIWIAGVVLLCVVVLVLLAGLVIFLIMRTRRSPDSDN